MQRSLEDKQKDLIRIINNIAPLLNNEEIDKVILSIDKPCTRIFNEMKNEIPFSYLEGDEIDD